MERDSVGKEGEEKQKCRGFPRISAAFRGAATGEGERLKGAGDFPSLLLSQSRAREHLPQQGTDKLHVKQQKVRLSGEAGQEKPDFVCTAEYFL